MKKILEFLQDGTGAFSATRLAFLCWTLGSLAVWAIACWLKKDFIPIPESIIEMNVVFAAGKVAGAGVENLSPKTGQ